MQCDWSVAADHLSDPEDSTIGYLSSVRAPLRSSCHISPAGSAFSVRPSLVDFLISILTLQPTGWQVNIASGSYLVATQIQGIIVLNDSSYVAQPWHATLMIIAVAAVSILFNTFFAKKLPLIEGIILIIHVFGFFGILIPLWALSPRQPASVVFTEFTNAYEWNSQGLACLVGIIGPMYSLLGPDSAVHMCKYRFADDLQLIPNANSIQLRRSETHLMSSRRP